MQEEELPFLQSVCWLNCQVLDPLILSWVRSVQVCNAQVSFPLRRQSILLLLQLGLAKDHGDDERVGYAILLWQKGCIADF